MKSLPPSLLFRAFKYYFQGRLHFDKSVNGEIKKEDDDYEVFRKIVLDAPGGIELVPGAIFRVTFNFRNLSAAANKKLSLLPTPFIVAQNGFISKTWMIGRKTGRFQGFYEWDTIENANQYWNSFPMKMMKKRSVLSSLQYEVYPSNNKSDQPNKSL